MALKDIIIVGYGVYKLRMTLLYPLDKRLIVVYTMGHTLKYSIRRYFSIELLQLKRN